MSQEQPLEAASAPLQEAAPDAWRKATANFHSVSELLDAVVSPPVGLGHETTDSHSHDTMQHGECKRMKDKIANDAQQTRASTDAEVDTDSESAGTPDLNGAMSSAQPPHSATYSYRMRCV